MNDFGLLKRKIIQTKLSHTNKLDICQSKNPIELSLLNSKLIRLELQVVSIEFWITFAAYVKSVGNQTPQTLPPLKTVFTKPKLSVSLSPSWFILVSNIECSTAVENNFLSIGNKSWVELEI